MKKYLLLCCAAMLFCHTATSQVKNYCLRLTSEGSVDCGAMPELNNAASFTVQFWMNADQWENGATILSRGEGFVVKQGNAKTLSITAGSKTLTATADALTTGKWVQVTVLCNSGTAKVLINKSQATSASGCVLPESEDAFVIGGGFKGRIDEIRVWNDALSADFDYFANNTLNKWVPQLENLVAYYKLDQEQCDNVVDYKALFVSSDYNHHGVMAETGVTREEVTDNTGLPYLLCGAYTNNARFYDRGVTRDQYLLANDIIMLGIKSFTDGHLKYLSECNHATANNATYLSEYEGRSGVLSVNGDGYLECPEGAFDPSIDSNGKASTGYTFETWIYLEEWTEGAYIFRRENNDGTQGFSIRLGEEENKHVIVRVNGNEFVNIKSMTVGEWVHFGVTAYAGSAVRTTFMFTYNGKDKWANANLSGSSMDYTPTGMAGCKAILGQGLKAKFDNTLIWNQRFDLTSLTSHMNNIPMPAIGKEATADLIVRGQACYLYDNADKLGWDSYSQDEWLRIMKSAYDGYRGYQIRISVESHDGWQTTISNASRRRIFAADLAKLSEGYDGVELDLEWMDGTQTNLGLLADEIKAALPAGKTLMISMHQYGAYKFPLDKMNKVDGFTFQQYGPQKSWFSYSSFVSGATQFANYGYPKDKTYLSYSTTTSGALNASDSQISTVISGVNKGFLDDDYTPDPNGGYEKKLFNGYYYYFMGPIQVYKRAKYCVDNNLQGIFFWDMGNDVKPTHKYCLEKYCSYALNSNVDSLVTKVDVNHPVGINEISTNNTNPESNVTYDLQGRRIVTGAELPRGIYIRNGRKQILK